MLSIVEEWREMGNWWDGGGEARFFVVLTDDRGLYELRCDDRDSWRLTRIFD